MCLVAKPAGPTSHDVVDIVRRALSQTRVGHLGTLDPFAEGLLVVVVGRATRLAQFAAPWRKRYEGVMRLGTVTTTDDGTGAVTATSDGWRTLTPDAVEAACAALRGEIEQRPPAFSAVKVDGERAYRRARRGESMAMAPRRVTIDELTVTEWRAPDLAFRATVSGGTYLRSLARDLGERLGCGAHLAELRRTGVGPFSLSDAVAPERVTPADLLPPATLVADLPKRVLETGERDAIVHGRPLAATDAEHGTIALMEDGHLLAVAEVSEGLLRPRLVLAEA